MKSWLTCCPRWRLTLRTFTSPWPAILYYKTDVNSILRALMNIMYAHLEDQQQLKEEQDRRFEEIEERMREQGDYMDLLTKLCPSSRKPARA